jgi:hypothetical protein
LSLLYRTAWLLALGIVVAVLVGMLLARQMVIPDSALQVGAQQLEASDFGHRIEVRTATRSRSWPTASTEWRTGCRNPMARSSRRSRSARVT